MIEIGHGNILEAEAEALVNTVNCVGVMGRGIALQFRKAYPENFKAYEAACQHEEVRPGRMFTFALGTLVWPRYVINFPTKTHWKGNSKLEYIESGLEDLIRVVRVLDIHTIAIPPLGCGLGGLRWRDVRPLIERAFEALPNVRVVLFEPSTERDVATVPRDRIPPKMTIGNAIVITLMRRYLAALMDPDVTLLELHKLTYFMQESGQQSLSLRFAKGLYGPYSENLRHVLLKIDGHFISGYGDGEDSPSKAIHLIATALKPASELLEMHPDTARRFERVSNLISGFESQYGLELLSTVHWVVAHEGAPDVDASVILVYDWNDRKRMFKKQHIQLAYDVLLRQNWLTNAATRPG